MGRSQVEGAGARAADTAEWARRLGVTHLGLAHAMLDEDAVARARARGLALTAWTPNDESELRRVVALGVDIITTDHPDLALRIRDGR